MDFKDGSRKTNFKKSEIVYLASILFPITEFSTVQECLAISMQAAKKLNQTYTFVTMDLAACTIAFEINFDDAERFSQVIIHIRFQIYIPLYAVCTTICNHSNAHKYPFVTIVFAAFDLRPQSK